MLPTYAIVPTHNRHAHLVSLVNSLKGDLRRIVVVDNASDPPVSREELEKLVEGSETGITVLFDPEQPPNLYRLWNIAFEVVDLFAAMDGASEWNTAVFNDDTVLPDGWVRAVSEALRASSAAVACGSENHSQTSPFLKTELRRFPRMTPHAFMVKGELGLRADEQFRWWWGDSDFDFQSTLSGGVLLIPGCVAANSCANSTTVGELAEQAGRDGQAFVAKWGGTF